jgi:hypothetical protein
MTAKKLTYRINTVFYSTNSFSESYSKNTTKTWFDLKKKENYSIVVMTKLYCGLLFEMLKINIQMSWLIQPRNYFLLSKYLSILV